jgi:serine palmitoyltransferase
MPPSRTRSHDGTVSTEETVDDVVYLNGNTASPSEYVNTLEKRKQQSNKQPYAKEPLKHQPANMFEEPHQHIPHITKIATYLSYSLVMLFGYIREYFRQVFPKKGTVSDGYAPIVRDYDDFYQRRLYRRIRDCWNRPIDSRPSRIIGVMERVSTDFNLTFQFTGRTVPCINLGSYNYLGFAEDTPSVTENVLRSIETIGVASCSAALEGGQTATLSELERAIAKFVGKDDAVVCGMGFATNFGGLPALFCKETLVLSDNLNHASLVAGVRMSGAKVKVFPHNDFAALEKILTTEIVAGQSHKKKPYKRVVLLVEGIYSMEGQVVDLAALVAVKKKFNTLLYVDEAHSIGAIGVSGRGVCEHCLVDPADVDILMGTFTKSFGSIGGYIAGSQSVINYVRGTSSISVSCDAIAGPCAQQALSVLHVILGEDGTDLGKRRIQQLAENSRFFRQGLLKLGFRVYGNDASPVVPVMLYNPGKLSALSRMCFERGLATVVVGYPATALTEGRVRFCVSACHTRQDLQQALDVMDDIANEIHLRYDMGFNSTWNIPKSGVTA